MNNLWCYNYHVCKGGCGIIAIQGRSLSAVPRWLALLSFVPLRGYRSWSQGGDVEVGGGVRGGVWCALRGGVALFVCSRRCCARRRRGALCHQEEEHSGAADLNGSCVSERLGTSPLRRPDTPHRLLSRGVSLSRLLIGLLKAAAPDWLT